MQERIDYLFRKCLSDELSLSEREEWARLVQSDAYAERIRELIQGTLYAERSYALPEEKLQSILQAVMQAEEPEGEETPVRPLRKWAWAAAVAAILLTVAGIRFWPASTRQQAAVTADVAPGGNKAILTLADGTQVTLDSAGNQAIGQGIRRVGAQLQYDGEGTTAYNTLTTPRGGQFRVKLPDGTLVWLNAASSLRYPTAFNGNMRQVSVTGEAYFEVARNTQKPFRVNVNNRTEIEVLGTHFNINAYEDESSLSATLLEGAVSVSAGRQKVVLRPGQQAQVTKQISINDHVDVHKVMAWKNGLFNFENSSLQEIMRQVARWYDVEVVYEGKVPELHFVGMLSRNKTLAALIRVLEDTGVRFKIEGKKLIVLTDNSTKR